MSKSEYKMHKWDKTGLKQFIFLDHADRHILIDWCEQEIGYCDWHAVGDHKNNMRSTVYAFKSLIDAMAFKMRWAG